MERRREPNFRQAEFLQWQLFSTYVFIGSVVLLFFSNSQDYYNVVFAYLVTMYVGNRSFWTYVKHRHSFWLTEFMFNYQQNIVIVIVLFLLQIYVTWNAITTTSSSEKDLNNT